MIKGYLRLYINRSIFLSILQYMRNKICLDLPINYRILSYYVILLVW